MRSRVAVVLLAAAGCMLPPRPVAVDPEVTFAAHHEHGGLALDRLAGGRTGRLVAPGWLRWPGAPVFVVEADSQTIGALWLGGPSQVIVRRGPARDAALVGVVHPAWEDGAIRLALEPADAPVLRTDLFAREGAGGRPPALSRTATSVLEVRGTYRAALRDPGGMSVGWLRVRVGPYQDAARMFDGVLPATVDPTLAAAAALALDGEIDWIEGQAINVYQGNSGGPLQQSIPMSR